MGEGNQKVQTSICNKVGCTHVIEQGAANRNELLPIHKTAKINPGITYCDEQKEPDS